MASGFIFAFKLYSENQESQCGVDWVEHMVKRLTASDIIHVEMIPVIGGHYTAWCEEDGRILMGEGSALVTSPIAHTAIVGSGYKTHSSKECLDDSSFHHIFVPMSEENLRQGISFLEMQEGKWYNYLALPFTVIPHNFKMRGIEELEGCVSTSKVFCGQMGLVLCYLSNIIDPSPVFLDPLYCTPSELYQLIMASDCNAMHCKPAQMIVMITDEGV